MPRGRLYNCKQHYKPHWNELNGEPVRNDSWTNDDGTCRQVVQFLDDNRDHYHHRNRMIQESE